MAVLLLVGPLLSVCRAEWYLCPLGLPLVLGPVPLSLLLPVVISVFPCPPEWLVL